MDDTPVAGASPIAGPPAGPDSPRGPARLAIIAAVARNGVIGAGNAMPWHLSADLKRFRALTTGHRVIMGRKTYESLGKPLERRENVVVSRDPDFAAPGCRVVRSLAAALENPALPPPAFCIGGAQLYTEALLIADEIHLTRIDADFAGDTYMPELDPAAWREASREEGSDPATGLRFAFVHLVRAGRSEAHARALAIRD